MTSADIHRARLSVDLEEPNRVSCRLLSPQQSMEEIVAIGRFEAADETIIADYRNDLESLITIGSLPDSALSRHREKRRLAAEALARIGLPRPIADQVSRLQKQTGKSTLMLEFSTATPALDCLPWELLGDPKSAYQGKSDLVVWRYIPQNSYQPWPENNVMLAAASPPEQRISPNVDGEFDDVTMLLGQSDRHDVQPARFLHCTNPLFTAALAANRPNLLHIAMHGDRASMYFERADPRDQDLFGQEPAHEPHPRQRIVSYEHLAGVIADIGSVRTAMLSVCFSAYTDEDDTSFARKLIVEGIPSAIGMVCSITPVASREFCRGLYRGICTGQPIADSYANAVIRLRQMPPRDEFQWSVPMLYGSDNVIPLPTDDYKRFLGSVTQAVSSIEQLRRNLGRLSLQVSSRPGNWRLDSTRAAMELGRVQKKLKHLRENVTANRVDSYVWQLEFDIGCAEIERKISLVRAAIGEVGDATGRASFVQASQHFRSATERLVPELDNMRGLVMKEFPVDSRAASAS